MTYLVMTPRLDGDAIELAAGTWRKKLLPVGKVDYKGRKLVFDKSYLERLAEAFNAKAYDQVPFQLADASNAHTNDPERTRGEVTGMQVTDDGLYVTVRATEAGNRVLEANPKLGVSARIVEEYARSDGKYYPAAVQHVLGTLDPRIPSLGSWERVAEMSNDAALRGVDMVIDLSAGTWDGEPQDFAATATGHPLSPAIRATAGALAKRHTGSPAAGHALSAADALDDGDHDTALAHLDTAYMAVPDSGGDASRADIEGHMQAVMADRGDTGTGLPDGYEDPGTGTANRPKHAGDYANDYGGAYLMMGADPTGGFDWELAHRQAAVREIEDAGYARLRRDEDILAAALSRHARGTYTAGRVVRLANDEYGAGGLGCSCGATGDDGQTVSRHHTAGCEFSLSADEQAEYRAVYAEIAAGAFTDSHGHTWADHSGRAMTLADHVEALTGQRITRAGEQYTGLERRELSVPQRVTRFGDLDGGEPGGELTEGSQAVIAALRAALNLPDHAADRQQKRLTAWDRWVQRPPQRFRSYGEALDYGGEVRRARQPEDAMAAQVAEFSNGDGDGDGEPYWAPSAIGQHGGLSW